MTNAPRVFLSTGGSDGATMRIESFFELSRVALFEEIKGRLRKPAGTGRFVLRSRRLNAGADVDAHGKDSRTTLDGRCLIMRSVGMPMGGAS